MADEDSQVFMGVPPSPARDYDFDFDDNAPVAPPVATRPDVPAKPAVVVGLAQARRQKRQSGQPPVPPAPPPPPAKRTVPALPTSKSGGRRAPLPKPFEEPTRAVQDAELLAQVRSAPGPGRVGGPPRGGAPFDDMPTKLGDIDARLLDDGAVDAALSAVAGEKFIPTTTEPQAMLFDDNEATRLSNVDGSLPGRTSAPSRDERTRAVDIRNDPSMSDVDWDID